MELSKARSAADKLLEARRSAVGRVKVEKKALAAAKDRFAAAAEAQHLLQHVAQQIQNQVHTKIAAVVTRCLQAVFGPSYTFAIRFDRKRGKTEARMVMTKKGKEVDPMDGSGGGVVDVVSFALRVAALMLERPSPRKFLGLDESFKHLSARNEYRDRARSLLTALASELGVQMVLVTHSEELEVGKVIEIGG